MGLVDFNKQKTSIKEEEFWTRAECLGGPIKPKCATPTPVPFSDRNSSTKTKEVAQETREMW